LYFDCGSEDRYRLYEGNGEIHRRLEAAGIPHQFTLAPGDHGYEFVRSRLPESLRFLGKRLKVPTRLRLDGTRGQGADSRAPLQPTGAWKRFG
jgi:hypothetical protein